MQDYLAWLDLEMTGLDPDQNTIIEIAVIITDADLNIIDQMPEIAIYQSPEILNNLDNWNKTNHHQSGLIEKVQNSKINLKQAEKITLDFVKKHLAKNQSPLCGNSIGQDRRFLSQYMPELEQYFHYRNIDVSTIKELAKRWYKDLTFKKQNNHRALLDIQESINELKFYRQYVFKK